MTTLLSSSLALIDQFLAPIVPAGVTGVQFISVFLIVYALTHLMLSRVKILNNNRPSQLLLALIIAYFTASSGLAVVLITKLFPNLGIITVLIVSFLAVVGLLTQKDDDKILSLPIMTIIGIGLVVYLVWSSMGATIRDVGFGMPTLSMNEWFTIVFLLIFVGVILLVAFTGGEDKGKHAGWDFLRELFGMDK